MLLFALPKGAGVNTRHCYDRVTQPELPPDANATKLFEDICGVEPNSGRPAFHLGARPADDD
jgi:hypothetical protein